ncbi:hypothetical protein SUGI_1085840 [Cryptomeria japonica]|nr:hypothetical protein SUGI_1085840 [Cryptomeria japonica]
MQQVIETNSINFGTKLLYLYFLALSANQLTGEMPPSLSNYSFLKTLALNDNQLSGTIPPVICEKLNNLRTLNLCGNKLRGNIPNSSVNCSKLELLYLAVNQLSGIVPKEVANLYLLEKISLYSNNLVTC